MIVSHSCADQTRTKISVRAVVSAPIPSQAVLPKAAMSAIDSWGPIRNRVSVTETRNACDSQESNHAKCQLWALRFPRGLGEEVGDVLRVLGERLPLRDQSVG